MSIAPYTLTPTSLNVLYRGRMRTLHNSNPGFARAVELVQRSAVTGAEAADLERILDIRTFLAKHTVGRVEIGDGEVRVAGRVANDYAVERVLAMMAAGHDVLPMARFIDKLQDNPTVDVRTDLWKWLEASGLPLCSDGDFIAFKKVREDYASYHDGSFDHRVGNVLEMPRSACDADRNATCSSGLHFASFAYLPHYRGSSGRVVILKINPADVVAIPTDYNLAKGRACRYEVVGEVPQDEAEKCFEGVHVWGDDLPDFDEDEAHNWLVARDDVDEEPDDDRVPDEEASLRPGSEDYYKLPDYVDCETVPAIRRVLNGDLDSLQDAFGWVSTPQGTAYWRDRAYGEVPLNNDDREYLRAILWQLGEDLSRFDDADVAKGVSIESIDSILAGNTNDLASAFTWDYSWHGHQYWGARHDSSEGLSALDRVYLKALRAEAVKASTPSWARAMRQD